MYGYKIFHEDMLNNLINSVRSGACSHAYIFEGAKGLFKHESAKLFAKALTCLSPLSAPCGVCTSCAEASADTNPDITYIRKPADKTRITVDAIRKMNDDAAVKPFNSPRKVYIIEDGDLLTVEAQNAFLKTFEEPPGYAVFIIIAETSDSLLPTILSRAVLITFSPAPRRDIERYLLDEYPEQKERIQFLVNFCDGIPGMAEDIINNPEFESLRTASLDNMKYLITKNKIESFKIEEFIEENKDYAGLIFDFWISFLRDILVLQCSAFDKTINIDRLSLLKRYSEQFSEKSVIRAITLLNDGKKMLDRYVKTSAAALCCALKINL